MKIKKIKNKTGLLACWIQYVGNGFFEPSYLINNINHIFFALFSLSCTKPKDVLILACLADVFLLKNVNTTYFLWTALKLVNVNVKFIFESRFLIYR